MYPCLLNILAISITGWLGILIILNPSQLSSLNIELNNLTVGIAFLGAMATALAYITVKKLSSTEDVFVIIMVVNLFRLNNILLAVTY